jgi:hypothetical protein
MHTEDHAHGYQQGTIPPPSPLPSFVSRSSGPSIRAAPQGETSENGTCRSRGNSHSRGPQSRHFVRTESLCLRLMWMGSMFLSSFTLPCYIFSLSPRMGFLALGYNLKYISLRIHPIGTSGGDGQLLGTSQNVPLAPRCLNVVLCIFPCYTA